MFQSYDHLQADDEDGHTTETCSGYWNKILYNYSNSVTLDRNPEPEPDLVHATGCRQPSLRLQEMFVFLWRRTCDDGYIKWKTGTRTFPGVLNRMQTTKFKTPGNVSVPVFHFITRSSPQTIPFLFLWPCTLRTGMPGTEHREPSSGLSQSMGPGWGFVASSGGILPAAELSRMETLLPVGCLVHYSVNECLSMSKGTMIGNFKHWQMQWTPKSKKKKS
jgi:hypothetical protein